MAMLVSKWVKKASMPLQNEKDTYKSSWKKLNCDAEKLQVKYELGQKGGQKVPQ
jgi:hypothetical protein